MPGVTPGLKRAGVAPPHVTQPSLKRSVTENCDTCIRIYSAFRSKDVQPPRSAASSTLRATSQGYFRKDAHLVLSFVAPPRAGQQEMVYLLSEVAREHMFLLPYPHLCVGARPRNSAERTPSPEGVALSRKSYPRTCATFLPRHLCPD